MSDRIAVLSNGKLQQIGRSTEVYDTPANAFVANFVGTSNLFTGRVTERNDRLLTVETANGRRLVACGDRFAVGDGVTLVLRPEHLRIVERDEGETGSTIDGTVKDAVFVGSVVHVHVDVGFGRTAILHHRHERAGASAAIAPGAAVRIAYSPESAHLIAAAGG